MLIVLRSLLRADAPAVPCGSLREFLVAHRASAAGLAPIDQAIVGGFAADRLGYAFAAGYLGALNTLVPDVSETAVVSLCATETGGVHPRAISTTLREAGVGRWRLDGRKRFATLGHEADTLLVVASTAVDTDGKNRLRLVRVAARAPGVTVTRIPDTPFAPEIGHAEIVLDGVLAGDADVLPGDGYDRYLKPFRTIEDAHVHAALLAHIFGVASHHGWPRHVREELLALVAAVRAVALEDPIAPEVHIALAGSLALERRLLDQCAEHWSLVPPEIRARWERDRPLLGVAEKARAARLETAWRLLGVGTP